MTEKGGIDIILIGTLNLYNRNSGQLDKASYGTVKVLDVRDLHKQGWNFDWEVPLLNGYDVFSIKLIGNNQIQGLVAVKPDGGAVEVNLIESAPHNVGLLGTYKNVGKHLMAIAAKYSFNNDCEGYMFLIAKTKLIELYEIAYGAKRIGNGQIMVFDTNASENLVNKFL